MQTNTGFTGRTFGVEIELVSLVDAQRAAEYISEQANVEVAYEGYNHNTRRHWKIVTDSSISTESSPREGMQYSYRYSFELVSPILSGAEGLAELRRVMEYIEGSNRYEVNSSCGLHVHHGAGDYDVKEFKNLLVVYQRFENTIDKMTRINSRWAKTSNMTIEMLRNDKELNTVQALQAGDRHDRYMKVNLQAYVRQGTIEFRQHHGTKIAEEVVSWVVLTQMMMEKAKMGKVHYKKAADDWFNMKKVLRAHKWMGADEIQQRAVRYFNKYLQNRE